MDQQKLRSLVFEKTGVRIDIDDPIFALVALNEAVLAEAVERHVALLDEATRELASQVEALAGGDAAPRLCERPIPALLKPAAAAATPGLAPVQRSIAVAAGAAVLGALLVLFGQALLFKPPAPVTLARELSPEQASAIVNAEKLNRAVQKLDQKTRNAIQAELQKP
ncbi:MAG: hypothetical protein V4508_25310 [Pseudomonadota bacterium]